MSQIIVKGMVYKLVDGQEKAASCGRDHVKKECGRSRTPASREKGITLQQQMTQQRYQQEKGQRPDSDKAQKREPDKKMPWYKKLMNFPEGEEHGFHGATVDDFEVPLFCMAEHYGVDPVEKGFYSDKLVRVYRDREGWHVGGIAGLTDDEWAPVDNQQAKELYDACEWAALEDNSDYDPLGDYDEKLREYDEKLYGAAAKREEHSYKQAGVESGFDVQISCIAEFFGLNLEDKGIDDDFSVIIYKDEEGWHVGGENAQYLTDEDWAPVDDRDAQELAEWCSRE
jgi:hypothetical protein